MYPKELEVSAGIAWLDKNRPGWLLQIDEDSLDMRSTCGCVMGQIDGNYNDFVCSDIMSLDERERHGFTIVLSPKEWKQLEEEWKRQIKILKKQALEGTCL